MQTQYVFILSSEGGTRAKHNAQCILYEKSSSRAGPVAHGKPPGDTNAVQVTSAERGRRLGWTVLPVGYGRGGNFHVPTVGRIFLLH